MISRIIILMLLTVPAMAQNTANRLNFKSGQSQMIAVYNGTVFVNGQRAYQFPADNIVYKSKRNKLVEDKKEVFLFVETTGEAGKKNRLQVFNIVFSRADSVTNVIASDIKDIDNDGYGVRWQRTGYSASFTGFAVLPALHLLRGEKRPYRLRCRVHPADRQ
ncbi:hypothetical protein MKQ70_03750 [Chitinophaga sedimenti]|uniref:hypothetical protein n=1 Tax=Chitinophaga sedimenti TaxID=2033606 RepID=UPI0020029F3C|nr:hypothetical protein [Chitinophaga sedimenti]MCK7554168.1 hypothetical protein [Chitinophaga sedimenti]